MMGISQNAATSVELRLRRRQLLGVAAVCLLTGAAVAAIVLLHGVNSQLDDIIHTYQVRLKARELVQALTNAETGQRGYLLTLDQNYLDPYHAASHNIDLDYSDLTALTGADPAQTESLAGLGPAIAAKQRELSHTIELAANGHSDQALAIVRSGDGHKLMDSIRRTLSTFITNEEGKLAQRNADVEFFRQLLVGALLAGLLGGGLLAYSLLARSQYQLAALTDSGERLRRQNEELERRVAERTVDLEEARALAERERDRLELLLQDTNHRIGNSLATVSSLLALQLNRAESAQVRDALEAARGRVQSIAAGHRRLRLGTDLETARADEFLEAVVGDLRAALPTQSRIALITEFEPMVIKARDATTIGIVVGELVTNALKHAFEPDASGRVLTRFGLDERGVPCLCVEDDGNGGGAAGPGAGLGSLIIKQLARQFGGEPNYARSSLGGTAVTIAMPTLAPSQPVVS
jgi:two-component sensor histidine kinase